MKPTICVLDSERSPLRYLETLEKGADNSTKDLMLEQFYESEFQSDEFMRNYYMKLIKVEPLVHYSIETVLEMELAQGIKDMKVAFPSWKAKTSMNEVIDKDLETLVTDLKKFTDEKIREMGSSHDEQKDGETHHEEGRPTIRAAS